MGSGVEGAQRGGPSPPRSCKPQKAMLSVIHLLWPESQKKAGKEFKANLI